MPCEKDKWAGRRKEVGWGCRSLWKRGMQFIKLLVSCQDPENWGNWGEIREIEGNLGSRGAKELESWNWQTDNWQVKEQDALKHTHTATHPHTHTPTHTLYGSDAGQTSVHSHQLQMRGSVNNLNSIWFFTIFTNWGQFTFLFPPCRRVQIKRE